MARTKQTARRKGGKRKPSDKEGGQDIAKQTQQSRKSAKAEKRAKRALEEPSLAESNSNPLNDSTILNADDESIPLPPSNSSNLNASSTNTTTSNIIIDPSLANSHDVTTMSILSSTQIQQRVTRTLSLLSTYPATPPIVVILHAKAKAASKMISIAEIVKREIAGGGGKWFQYNSVDKSMEEQKGGNQVAGHGKGKDADQEMGEEEEEDSFETMKTPFERTIEGTVKVRAVPIMMIYLSRVRVESLRREYGEQTNATGLPQ